MRMDALWDIIMESREPELNERRTPDPDRIPRAGLAQERAAGFPGGKTSSLHFDAASDAPFAALELRDRVVIMLLFDQVVREDQVELAWRLWEQMRQEGDREPLWRVFTLFPDLDRDLVYAEAARVYGFEEARFNRRQALQLIHRMEQKLDPAAWEQAVELRVVPVAVIEPSNDGPARTVFAVHDPTRPEVHRLVKRLAQTGFELRFAPEGEILNLLVEAFPQRYNHLKGLSGLSKDFLAGSGAAVDAPWQPGPADQVVDQGVIDFFEDALAAAVQDGATDVCLLPSPGGDVDVYFQYGDDLRRWKVADAWSADTVIRTIKQGIIRAPDCGEGHIQKRSIERIVEGRLCRFRVAAVPPSEDVHAECIVVHVYV